MIIRQLFVITYHDVVKFQIVVDVPSTVDLFEEVYDCQSETINADRR
jgi:hypothetical protein